MKSLLALSHSSTCTKKYLHCRISLKLKKHRYVLRSHLDIINLLKDVWKNEGFSFTQRIYLHTFRYETEATGEITTF